LSTGNLQGLRGQEIRRLTLARGDVASEGVDLYLEAFHMAVVDDRLSMIGDGAYWRHYSIGDVSRR
jgi:hypothetical protein